MLDNPPGALRPEPIAEFAVETLPETDSRSHDDKASKQTDSPVTCKWNRSKRRLQIRWEAEEMEPLKSDRLGDAAHAKCPLCGSFDTLCEAKIDTDSIAKLYGKDQRELVRNDLKGSSSIDVYRCQSCLLCFFEPRVPGSAAFYASFQSMDWYYLKDKAEYDMAIKWMPLNSRVLEVGCGVGWFAKKIPTSQYTGLEYSDSAVEAARASGLDVRAQSVEEHSLTHKSAYQVVCSFQVLEHVSEPGSFIGACVDCLEPGGLLICAVPSDDSYLQFAPNSLNLPPHHLSRWPDKTLEAIPRIFPVSLVAIEHEALADAHVRSYVITMIRKRLGALLGQRDALIDHSVSAKLVGRCAYILSGWMSRIFDHAAFRPIGNTVIGIYRKEMPLDSESTKRTEKGSKESVAMTL